MAAPVALLLLTLTLLLALVSPALAADGDVRFERRANGAFNSYTDAPSSSTQAWLRNHFDRFTTYSPYADSRLSWLPASWAYVNAYGISSGSSFESDHGSWLLQAAGGKAYIPWGCGGGSCPLDAADIANPDFRNFWIAQARGILAAGYRGLWIDDVDLPLRISDGNGASQLPYSPYLGRTIGQSEWEGLMASFMEQIRAAFPNAEIVHNSIWYASYTDAAAPAAVDREIQAATWVNMERGVSDAGLTGGTGAWSVSAWLGFIDHVHALGRSVVIEGETDGYTAAERETAAYLLASNGNDFVSQIQATPNDWWPGFDLTFGSSTGGRYTSGGLIRRDFSAGHAYLNPPGSASVTVTVPSGCQRYDGTKPSSVTIAAGNGLVLYCPPAGAAPPVKTPVPVSGGSAAAPGVQTTPANTLGVKDAVAAASIATAALQAHASGAIVGSASVVKRKAPVTCSRKLANKRPVSVRNALVRRVCRKALAKHKN